MSCKCTSDIFRIAQTFHYPFSPIPMGFVSCDTRDLAGLQNSALDHVGHNVSKKSRVTRKNGPCLQLNTADTKILQKLNTTLTLETMGVH